MPRGSLLESLFITGNLHRPASTQSYLLQEPSRMAHLDPATSSLTHSTSLASRQALQEGLHCQKILGHLEKHPKDSAWVAGGLPRSPELISHMMRLCGGRSALHSSLPDDRLTSKSAPCDPSHMLALGPGGCESGRGEGPGAAWGCRCGLGPALGPGLPGWKWLAAGPSQVCSASQAGADPLTALPVSLPLTQFPHL